MSLPRSGCAASHCAKKVSYTAESSLDGPGEPPAATLVPALPVFPAPPSVPVTVLPPPPNMADCCPPASRGPDPAVVPVACALVLPPQAFDNRAVARAATSARAISKCNATFPLLPRRRRGKTRCYLAAPCSRLLRSRTPKLAARTRLRCSANVPDTPGSWVPRSMPRFQALPPKDRLEPGRSNRADRHSRMGPPVRSRCSRCRPPAMPGNLPASRKGALRRRE